MPTPFAAILRERLVCTALLSAGVILVIANKLGIHAWVCVFHEVTGLPCPGCGLTRGMGALARGDLSEALRWHPFTPFFAIGAVLLLVATILPKDKREPLLKGLAKLEASTGFSLVLLCALMVFGFWRMLQGPRDF